jgi:beta-fructofuranosidase
MICNDKWNPKFHIFPEQGGWVNDPNGLCQIDGIYHVFCQYRPDAPDGSGTVAWGHFTSKDLLHWQFVNEPIRPDSALDKDGAFSGSALVENGRLFVLYTGNVQPDEKTRLSNTILVSSANAGRTFGPKRAVMTNADYPTDISCDIRDPKVWKEGGAYKLILGARTKADKGEVLLFSSQDLYAWRLETTLTTDTPFGYMWECPGIFSLGDKTFLSVCPQGVKADGMLYNNIYQSGYFTLKDGKLSDFTEWDRGFDFYAPQEFADESGRKILIGWEGLSDSPYQNPSVELGWQHMLTLPRVLEPYEKDGRIRIAQRPAPKLKELYSTEEDIQAGKDSRPYSCFIAQLANTGGSFTVHYGDLELNYDDVTGRFAMAFTAWNSSIGAGRSARRAQVDGVRSLTLVVDVSSVEAFVNDGEEVFTTRIYPDGPLPLHTYGAGLSGKIYDIKI